MDGVLYSRKRAWIALDRLSRKPRVSIQLEVPKQGMMSEWWSLNT